MRCCQTCDQPPSSCSCPDITRSGEILVSDDNCKPRRLFGTGLAYSNGDSTQLTDGAEHNGLIILDPPSTVSAAGLTVTDKNGTVLKLDRFTEGDVLTIEGGQIVFKSLQDVNNIYDPSKIRDGVGRLATFICAENGRIRLGRYDGCLNGLLGFTDNVNIAPAKTPYCVSWEAVALKMVEFLCAEIPDLEDDDETTGNLICTNNGIRKGEAGNSKLWLENWSVIIAIHTVGVSTPPGGPIAYYLPGLPGATVDGDGPSNVDVAFNFTTVPGYNVVYKNAIMYFVLKGTTYGEFYDAVLLINNREYCRIAVVGNENAGSNVNNIIFSYPIPDNGIANVKFVYQTQNLGADSAVIAMAYCIGFEK